MDIARLEKLPGLNSDEKGKILAGLMITDDKKVERLFTVSDDATLGAALRTMFLQPSDVMARDLKQRVGSKRRKEGRGEPAGTSGKEMESNTSAEPAGTSGKEMESIERLCQKSMERLCQTVAEKLSQTVEMVAEKLSQTVAERSVSQSQMMWQDMSNSCSSRAQLSDTGFGRRVRAEMISNKQNEILPRPLSARDADKVLRRKTSYAKVHKRFSQSEFKHWMTEIQSDKCRFQVLFTGDDKEPDQGWKKCDFTIVTNGDAVVAINTVVVLSLQSAEGTYNSDKEIGVAIRRAEQIIRSSGHDRKFCVAGVTNGIKVQWYLLERLFFMNGQRFVYYKTSEYDFRESLCAFLTSHPKDLYFSKMEPIYIDGKELVFNHCLGFGATSKVYSCDYGGQPAAAKMYSSNYNSIAEVDVLNLLKDVSNIPTVLASNSDVLVMTPVGETLSSAIHIEEVSAAKMSNLVDTLQQAHSCGYVHRDVRPPNILKCKVAEVPNVVLIDWGFATQSGKESPFAGSLITASDSILSQLSNTLMQPPAKRSKKHIDSLEGTSGSTLGGISIGTSSFSTVQVKFQPQDDLSSLVRSLFLFTKKDDPIPTDITDICTFWKQKLAANEVFLEAEKFAMKCDYNALRDWVNRWSKMTFTGLR